MTKAELIERIKDLPDNAPIRFVLFTTNKRGAYVWRLMNQTIDHNDPPNIIGLATTPIDYNDIREVPNE